jgi:hypothetical protein
MGIPLAPILSSVLVEPAVSVPPVEIPPVPTPVEAVPPAVTPPVAELTEEVPPVVAVTAPPLAETAFDTVGIFDSTFSVFSPQPDPSQVVTNVPNKPKIQIRPPQGYCLEAIGGDIVDLRLMTISKRFLAL